MLEQRNCRQATRPFDDFLPFNCGFETIYIFQLRKSIIFNVDLWLEAIELFNSAKSSIESVCGCFGCWKMHNKLTSIVKWLRLRQLVVMRLIAIR